MTQIPRTVLLSRRGDDIKSDGIYTTFEDLNWKVTSAFTMFNLAHNYVQLRMYPISDTEYFPLPELDYMWSEGMTVSEYREYLND